MKESLSRIAAWAKAHPWLAGLIGVGVLLAVYFTLKRGGLGGGASMASAEGGPQVAQPYPDFTASGGAGLPPFGGGSGDYGSFTPLPPETAPVEPGAGGGSSGGFSGFGYGGDYAYVPPPVENSYPITMGGGAVNSDSYNNLSQYEPGAETDRSGMAAAIAAHPAIVNARKPTNEVTPYAPRGSQIQEALRKHPNVARMAKPVHKPKPPKNTGVYAPRPSGIAQSLTVHPQVTSMAKPMPKTKPPASTYTKTPAELKGLYRYYTGMWGGITYVLGYPVFGSSSSSGSGSAGGGGGTLHAH